MIETMPDESNFDRYPMSLPTQPSRPRYAPLPPKQPIEAHEAMGDHESDETMIVLTDNAIKMIQEAGGIEAFIQMIGGES